MGPPGGQDTAAHTQAQQGPNQTIAWGGVGGGGTGVQLNLLAGFWNLN